MSIQGLLAKIKSRFGGQESHIEVIDLDEAGKVIKHSLLDKIFLSALLILLALFSFGLGRLSVISAREPIKIEYDSSLTASVINTRNESSSSNAGNGEVVTSKNGTRYHYLNCPGAKQIKTENKIMFASPAAAEAAGYTLAANCSPR